MTELELYKFIHNNNIECHKHQNEGKDDIIIFPNFYHLEKFSKLIESYTDEDGMEIVLKNGYVAIWMRDLCEHYGIDIDNIFTEFEK